MCLATAHPIKFLSAVLKATDVMAREGIEKEILAPNAMRILPFDVPKPFVGMLDQPTRCLDVKADTKSVKKLILEMVKPNEKAKI